jgi:transcriptional regulator with XRE-family HTH domain
MTKNKNSELANRLVQLRKRLQLSQSTFAKKIDITQGGLSQLESGKSELSLSTIQNISQAFSIDCNWLVLGDKFEQTMVNDLFDVESQNKNLNVSISIDKLIPLVDQEAHAGYIGQADDPEYLSSLEVYRIPGFESGNYRMFEIEGDSMIPSIHPHEIVVTEKAEDVDRIENGALCIVVTTEGIVAKRFYRYKEEPSNILLKSDNPDYKTYSVTIADISEIWEIKAKITSVLNKDISNSLERFETIESDIMRLKNSLQALVDTKNSKPHK